MSLSSLIPPGTFYRMGSSGSTVKEIQRALGKLGYPLTGTGYFGSATDTAVEAFQKRAGLTVDGDFGNQSAKALDRALGTDLAAVPALTKSEIGQPLWLQAGIKLLGTKEVPGKGDNPTIIQWAKDEGGEIAENYTHDSIPWCALGINHILTKAGLKGTETLWALDFNADLMQKRVGHRWPGVPLLGLAVGAIVPMLRNGGGHVMCIAGKDQHGNVMGLGFNQSDAVTIAPFATSRLNRGYWWPSSVVLPKNTGMSTLPVVRSDGRISSNEA